MDLKLSFLDKLFSMFRKKAENVKQAAEVTIVKEASTAPKTGAFDKIMLPLGEMCTKAKVYHCPDTVNGYGMCLNSWLDYHKLSRITLLSPMKNLETLANALTHMKIVTQEDIYVLSKAVTKYERSTSDFSTALKYQYEHFIVNNADEDMVHWAYVSIGTVDDKIPYMRIHRYFFRGRIILPALPVENIKRNTTALDRLITILDTLRHDMSEVGEGNDYELYRKRQNDLIEIAMRLTDAIEMDCEMNKRFLELARTPLNIRVYPCSDNEG